MKSIIHQLQELFYQSFKNNFNDIEIEKNLIEITPSTQEKFGDYQCNSAMKLTKLLKLPPRQIAEQLIDLLPKNALITLTEIAGPGFINITIDKNFISSEVQNILKDSHLGIELPERKERIVVDFSSPNIAKELHVGHLRSTIIGDCLANLFEFLGHDVLRLNHIGDWGTAFGMLIAYLKEQEPEVLNGNKKTDLSTLVKWYKLSKEKFDSDPDFKKRSQEEVSILQNGDPKALFAWKIICEISSDAYREIYQLLDINIIDRGESFYNPFLQEVLKDFEEKGLITISDGAKCLFLEGFQNREGEALPLILQKSDGGYNYATTDMAAMKHRIQIEKADRIIILTDAGQATHFEMILKGAQKVGYFDANKIRFNHVPFGLVLSPNGKKFKTRSGETERLIDLLLTAIEKAEEILKERSPEMEERERKSLAKILGINAIKYADLSCNRTSDYTFSYERMLRFDGNTAAYLMYSYVRIESIKKRLNSDIENLLNENSISLSHSSEIALGLHLLRFSESLDLVAQDLLPNRLTDYLYVLAEKFNAFFRDCHVEGTPEQNSRLLLCEATGRILKKGLEILGVKTINRM